MMRFLKWLFLLPISAGIVLLAIANRHFVPVLLDPFGHDTPDLEISAPLFVVIFGAMIIGVIFGGIATWLGQSKHRIAARRAKSELSQIRNERRPGSKYAAFENCRYEVAEAETMMKRHQIAWLSSTHKSIEEIATTILQELHPQRLAY